MWNLKSCVFIGFLKLILSYFILEKYEDIALNLGAYVA